jgi:hypothetical protein
MFTFKTTKASGSYAAFQSEYHEIKLKKKMVGTISNRGEGYKIHLRVIKEDINENGNPNCVWKNVTLKKTSDTLQEAKDYLNSNFEQIINQFPLYQED